MRPNQISIEYYKIYIVSEYSEKLSWKLVRKERLNRSGICKT